MFRNTQHIVITLTEVKIKHYEIQINTTQYNIGETLIRNLKLTLNIKK